MRQRDEKNSNPCNAETRRSIEQTVMSQDHIERHLVFDLFIDGFQIARNIESLEVAQELAGEFIQENLPSKITGREYLLSGSCKEFSTWTYSYEKAAWLQTR